jgi:hypothetical protein
MAKFGINVFLIQLLNVTAFVLLIPEINVFCMAKNIDLRNFEDIEHSWNSMFWNPVPLIYWCLTPTLAVFQLYLGLKSSFMQQLKWCYLGINILCNFGKNRWRNEFDRVHTCIEYIRPPTRVNSKDRQYNGQQKRDKKTNNGQEILHRKLKSEHHQPN